jgi:hypothetical protein
MRFVRDQNTPFGQKANHLARKKLWESRRFTLAQRAWHFLIPGIVPHDSAVFSAPEPFGAEWREPSSYAIEFLAALRLVRRFLFAFPIFPIGLASAVGKRAALCRTPEQPAPFVFSVEGITRNVDLAPSFHSFHATRADGV